MASTRTRFRQRRNVPSSLPARNFGSECPSRYAEGVARPSSGPGVRKVRQPDPLTTRSPRLVRCEPHWVQDLFAYADVMSEGAWSADGSRYYGTTSILLRLDAQPARPTSSHRKPETPTSARDTLNALAADPHARVLALRVARREALVRARTELATAFAELSVQRASNGLLIRIEIEAAAALAHTQARAEST